MLSYGHPCTYGEVGVMSSDPLHQHTRVLVAVLANPPLHTSGRRTHERVALLASLLGAERWSSANLLETPTNDVTGISAAARDRDTWLTARPALESALEPHAVLLAAWGLSEPTGPARQHQREQLAWMRSLPQWQGMTVIGIGGRPRHPSRWQRYTCRQWPSHTFSDALRLSVKSIDSSTPHF